MDNFGKAMTMLAAAITMNALGTQAALAGVKKKVKKDSGKSKVAKQKAKAKSKKRVKRVKKARQQPEERRPELSMPAGTLYDVVAARDIPNKERR